MSMDDPIVVTGSTRSITGRVSNFASRTEGKIAGSTRSIIGKPGTGTEPGTGTGKSSKKNSKNEKVPIFIRLF